MGVYRITTEDGEYEVTLDDRETPSTTPQAQASFPGAMPGMPPNVLSVPGMGSGASLNAGPVTASEAEEPTGGAQWRDVPAKALKDSVNIPIAMAMMNAELAKRQIMLPYDALKNVYDILTGQVGEDTPMVSQGKGTIDAIKGMASGLAQEVAHPIESFKERPVSTALDVAGIALPVLRGATGAAAKVGGKVGKSAMAVTMGPSLENIETRFARNAEIKAAKPFDVLAAEIPAEVQKIADNATELSGKALDKLSTSRYLMDGAKTKDALLGAIKTAQKNLGGGVSNATRAAKKALATYAERIGKLRETISERQLGDIVRDMRKDINYGDTDRIPLSNALKEVNAKIDGLLKKGNEEYRKAMVPVDQNMLALKKAENLFRLKQERGEYLPSDTAADVLKRATEDKKLGARKVLEDMKKLTKRDLLREAENAKVVESFEGGRANGSRRVNLGGMLGRGVGGVTGALLGFGGGGVGGGIAGGIGGEVLGGMAGAYLDTQGARVAANIIDEMVKRRALMPNFSIPTTAVERGARKIAAPALAGRNRGTNLQELLLQLSQ